MPCSSQRFKYGYCHVLEQLELQSLVPAQRLSTNDVLSALLWHVACDIRGRARPWHGSKKGSGCLAYPSNLRPLHAPPHYCANALLLNLLGGITGCTVRCA